MDPYARHHPVVRPDERVGNAQRTTVLDLLSRAVEQGYLDLDEFEARTTQVTAAKTVAALYTATADLPPQFRWNPVQPAPHGRPSRESVSGMALASFVLGLVSIGLALCGGIGGFPGIAAVVLGFLGLRDDASRPKALTGILLGLVGITASLVVVVLVMLT